MLISEKNITATTQSITGETPTQLWIVFADFYITDSPDIEECLYSIQSCFVRVAMNYFPAAFPHVIFVSVSSAGSALWCASNSIRYATSLVPRPRPRLIDIHRTFAGVTEDRNRRQTE